VDIQVGQDPSIKVVIELFNDLCPKTSEAFMNICQGKFKNKAGKEVSYTGTTIHRIVNGAYFQGGSEIESGPENEFPSESYACNHDEVGLVGLCKRKNIDHTNAFQFYITTAAPLNFMNNNFVVIGKVVQGMRAFRVLDKVKCENERPKTVIKISASGKFGVEAKVGGGGMFKKK
jgi:cyclophilin family peptidyl-prolyl cis-trans isomerase